jgi:hypothetical protein
MAHGSLLYYIVQDPNAASIQQGGADYSARCMELSTAEEGAFHVSYAAWHCILFGSTSGFCICPTELPC